jgi:hypothetical protein
MRFSGITPTSQLPGRRPISFLLDNGGSIGAPVTLTIRPEDLTRNEPARASVYQTMGRNVSGWVDHFGEALPSVSISGHTGWRDMAGSGTDGAAAFALLNKLVVRDFPAAKQAAIDSGRNPADVKLLFVDLLDDFVWSVAPTVFTLRRNKSSPLLYRYNINLQAVSARIDAIDVLLPFFGSVSAGMGALDSVTATIVGFAQTVEPVVSQALGFVDKALAPISAVVKSFVALTARVLSAVSSAIRSAGNLINGVANRLIGLASMLASVGRNIFRTFNAIMGLPGQIKAAIGRITAAFNEVACIFKNSLRPSKTYEEYTGLYGASNCSSTTGGRSESQYVSQNPFALMQADKSGVSVSTAAATSMSALSRSDPVLSPMSIPEVGRNLTNVVSGVSA